MNKYLISFNATWEGTEWTLANITYFGGEFGETEVTDTLEAVYYSINQSELEIPDNSFANSSLTSITIPDTVDSIGNNTFLGSSDLNNVRIMESIISIGTDAFSGTGITIIQTPSSNVENLKTVMAENNPTLVDLVVAIPEYRVKKLEENGESFVPVTHAGSTYVNETNGAGKSKTVADKLEEIGTSISSSTGELETLEATVESQNTALNTLNGTGEGSVNKTITDIVNNTFEWSEI